MFPNRILAGLVLMALSHAQAQAFCFEEASAMYGVPATLLRGIAHVESAMNPMAVNASHVRKTGSLDIGLMQINTRWLTAEPFRSLGYRKEHLFDACTNVKVGAWILANEFRNRGFGWDAVGAYNASCKSLKGDDCTRARSIYAWRVYRAMRRQS
jgi:soluble lytic murein transglycosylase-like protein